MKQKLRAVVNSLGGSADKYKMGQDVHNLSRMKHNWDVVQAPDVCIDDQILILRS